jgi:hypothetical protein
MRNMSLCPAGSVSCTLGANTSSTGGLYYTCRLPAADAGASDGGGEAGGSSGGTDAGGD